MASSRTGTTFRVSLVLAAAVFALLLTTTASGATQQVRNLRHGVAWNRSHAWYWQDQAGLHRSPTVYAERRTASVPYLHYLIRKWSGRLVYAKHRALARPAIAHYSLWSCITKGAYPGAPHEGNGYNGPYSGPLGMTTPWEGHYPPGSDWVHSPVSAVYAIAEQEYREHGYSRAWLTGQWPNTSPPCLGYA